MMTLRIGALLAAALFAAPAAGIGGAANAAQTRERAGATWAQRTLPNGLRVVVIRNPLSPVVATWMNYLVGSDDDGATPGIAHAAEHMMFRGSRSVSAAQFADVTAIMGGDFNGETGSEVTNYRFEVPAADLEVAMQLEASRARELADDPALWERERGPIGQEVAQRNGSPSYRLMTRMLANLMHGSPYANEGLGTLESFRTLSAAQLRAFHARYYHPDNAIYVVAGDVDPDDVFARAASIFGSLPPGHVKAAARPVPPAPKPATIVDAQNALPANYVLLGYRMPGYDSPDYAAARVLFDVLASDRGPLRRLRDDGTVLRSDASLRSFPGASAGFVGTTVPVTADPDAAAAKIRSALDEVRAAGIAPDDVAAAKRRLLTSAAVAQSSIQEQARTWSYALAVERRTPDDDTALIGAVTPAAVNEVLKASLTSDSATLGIAISKPGARPARGDANAPDRAAAVARTGRPELPQFARPLLDRLAAPAPEAPPYEAQLPNGLRLVVVTNTATGAVAIRGLVRTDPELQEPAGREGVATVLEAAFQQPPSGDGAAETRRRLDLLGAEPWAGSGFGADVAAGRFDDAVDLLARLETTSPASEENVRAAVRRVAAQVRGRAATPSFAAESALCTALYGAAGSHCRTATPESVARIAPADVAAYYARAFRPDETTLVVVGSVGAQHALAAVTRAFGGWRADGPRPVLDRPASPLNAASDATVSAPGTLQANVTLAEIVPVVRRDDDFVALRLANALLTGGVFGSLLYEDLRENTGYVYSVGSQFQSGPSESVFRIAYGADPKNVRAASGAIVSRLRDLREHEVEPARLARTKAMILSDIPLTAESYAGLAQRILYYAANGLPPDTAQREAGRILAVTPAGIRNTVAKYVRPERFAAIVQAPPAETARP